jgi:hypothetical protein
MDELYSNLNSVLAERYTTNAARIHELGAPLTNGQFWKNPFPYGNSFGHLVLHLTGNLNYYVGAQIAGSGYIRNRPREFADSNPPSKEETIRQFDEAVAMVLESIRHQSAGDWSKEYSGVGAKARNRLDMVVACAAHMQHHIGQMIYLTYELGRLTNQSAQKLGSATAT